MKYLSLVALISTLILTGCTNNFNSKSVTIDSKKFNLEIADSPAEREKGLMDRSNLPKGEGMLFVFDKPDIQSFWMKNTLVPLQIIFVDSCKVVDIKEMPLEKDPGNPAFRYISKSPADKVIELNSKSVPENIIGQTIQELCD